jgi:hypothetical protein
MIIIKRFPYSNRIKISLGFGFIFVHLLIVQGQTFFHCLHGICMGALHFFFSSNAFFLLFFSVDVHIFLHLHGHFKNNLTKVYSRKQNNPPTNKPVSQPLNSQTYKLTSIKWDCTDISTFNSVRYTYRIVEHLKLSFDNYKWKFQSNVFFV